MFFVNIDRWLAVFQFLCFNSVLIPTLMTPIQLPFVAIARDAGLSSKEREKFVEGMATGDEDELVLERSVYNRLQLSVEAAVLKALKPDGEAASMQSQKPPLLYATPGMLTPLYKIGHPRGQVVGQLFKAGLARSVMSDNAVKGMSDTDEFKDKRGVLAALVFWGNQHGVQLFSTTLDENQVLPPRMVMHLDQSDGSSVQVAFSADQFPSEAPGGLVFGAEATEWYQAVQALHEGNVTEGRGAEYLYEMCTGQKLTPMNYGR